MDEGMRIALEEARLAYLEREVPVGAALFKDGVLLARAHNHREKNMDIASHAEIEVMREGARILGSWSLEGCTLYVTLEPCPMCMGAIINARLDRVVYGAKDAKAGCCGSMLDLNDFPFNHHPAVMSDVCKEECANALSSFFAALRIRRKKKTSP